MKLKIIASILLATGLFVFSAPKSQAYVDSLGRVWPGKKPAAKHKVVKKTAAKKPVVKVKPKVVTKKK